jgi:histidyl-tRNA synthetase
MTFQAVKGMRDFYPDAMRVRNWLLDTWRRVSIRNGFEEFDAPILEYLDLFTAKSGEGIVSELFNLTDRGGRQLAIRAEMTPSLARMINAKVNSLPRPIKWFCLPQLCRAENPQKGRGREFFQWNVDIVGEPSVLADAECIFVAVDALRELGLTSADATVRYSSRALLTAILQSFGVAGESAGKVMATIDKQSKVPPDVFEKMLAEAMPDPAGQAAIKKYLQIGEAGAPAGSSHSGEITVNDVAGGLGIESTPAIAAALADIDAFQNALAAFGIADWCRFDPHIIRGLAYYTGIVYEIFDADRSLRAVAGGGRYDNLLESLGGPAVPATGFGMGDMVLRILLEQKGKVPQSLQTAGLDFFVMDDGDGLLEKVLSAAGALRSKGLSADFNYKRQALGKQLKDANKRGAKCALIIRAGGAVAVKNLRTGEQSETTLEAFLIDPGKNITK